MKLKVEVDLNDMFQFDEEGEEVGTFKEEIVAQIVWQVKTQVWDEFKKLITKEFIKSTTEQLKEELQQYTNTYIKEFIENEKIVQPHYSGDAMTFKEYVILKTKSYNTDNYRRTNELIMDYLRREGELVVKELQDRYDVHFANQLIVKMKNAGMLTENIAQIVIE